MSRTKEIFRKILFLIAVYGFLSLINWTYIFRDWTGFSCFIFWFVLIIFVIDEIS